MTTVSEWLATAPSDLVALMRRMTWHHKVNWNAPDYIVAGDFGTGDDGKPKGDGRETVGTLEAAEALSSKLRANPWAGSGADGHILAIDIDVPAWLVPSSTPGHSHLYVNLNVLDADLWAFLDAAAVIGLVEPGYVSACKSRGMTSLRAPWITKGAERPAVESEPF